MAMDGFQVRVNFFAGMMRGQSPSPLTGDERVVLEHAHIFEQFDEMMKGDFSRFAMRMVNDGRASLRDLLFFVIDAAEVGQMEAGLEMLRAADETGSLFDTAALVEMFSTTVDSGVHPMLTAAMSGKDKEEPIHEPVRPRKPALNFDAMRDFK